MEGFKMKRKLIGLFLGLFLVFGVVGGASAANITTGMFKENFPEVYECIKSESMVKWGTDYEMVKWNMKQQMNSYIEFMLMVNKHKDTQERKIVLVAAIKWGATSKTPCGVDWEMAVWEAKNQLKAYKSLQED